MIIAGFPHKNQSFSGIWKQLLRARVWPKLMLSDKLKSLYLPVVNVPSAWKMRSVFLWLFLSSLGTLVRSGMLFEIFGKQRLSWNLKWKRLIKE